MLATREEKLERLEVLRQAFEDAATAVAGLPVRCNLTMYKSGGNTGEFLDAAFKLRWHIGSVKEHNHSWAESRESGGSVTVHALYDADYDIPF